MNKRLESFKESHLAIVEQMDQIHHSIRSYNEAKPKLQILQSILLNHFVIQKQNLYDQLEEAYASDREKSKLIEFLKTDLKDLKIKILLFFDDHPADLSDQKPKHVVQDFDRLASDVLGRIHHEKKYLFPMLEGINA